jgi:hypothetical protein
MVLSKILSGDHQQIIKNISNIFESLATFFKKLNMRIMKSHIANKNNDFYKKNCLEKISCYTMMQTLFEQIFQNIDIVPEPIILNLIHQLMYTCTGHNILNIFISFRKSFTQNETLSIFKTVSSSIIEINNLISLYISNNIDKFFCSVELMEYASFIPIVQYVEQNIKNIVLSKEIFNNIILYSNNIELCKYIIENNAEYIDNECMNLCLKSRNKHIILLFYNLKIQYNYNTKKLSNPIEFDENNNIILYTEKHKYIDATLIRTIKKEDFCSDKQLKQIFNFL